MQKFKRFIAILDLQAIQSDREAGLSAVFNYLHIHLLLPTRQQSTAIKHNCRQHCCDNAEVICSARHCRCHAFML